jgi:hypothetical protein
MALRLIQFLAIMLTALALVPSGVHLPALPNKMAMAQAAYFIAQQIYAGWALFGIVLFGALAANLAHTIVLCRLARSFGYWWRPSKISCPIHSRLMDCSQGCSYADGETPGHVLAPLILARHVVKYWIIGLSFCMIS